MKTPEEKPNVTVNDLKELTKKTVDELNDEKIQSFLNSMGHFPYYSAGNNLLIYAQSAGTATRVASYDTWKSMDRHVKKGSKAIRIIMPDPENKNQLIPQAVFDVASTDGADIRPSRLIKDLTDKEVQTVYSALQEVTVEPIPSFNAGEDLAANLYAITEELLLETMEDIKDKYALDFIASSATYVACQYHGIPTTNISVVSYDAATENMETKEKKELLSNVQKATKTMTNTLSKSIKQLSEAYSQKEKASAKKTHAPKQKPKAMSM